MKTTGKSNATLTVKNSNKQQLRLLIGKQSAKVELLSCKAAEIKLGSFFLPSSSFVLFLFCSSFYANLLLFFVFPDNGNGYGKYALVSQVRFSL